MLCGVVVGPGWKEACEQLELIEEWADLVEFRVDLFEDEFLLESLRERVTLPLILTLREGTLDNYHDLLELEPEYVDLDCELGPFECEEVQVIRSFHDFEKTPQNLEAILEELQQMPADLYKIATTARSSCDALRMLQLVKKHQVIGLAMGPLGCISRILGKVLGCPMTYAAATAETKSASGQLTVEELVNTYHFQELTQKTELYGLIGDPVDKSRSDQTHNRCFEQLGHDAIYVKMAVKKDEIDEFLPLAHELSFKGLSVTMPLKERLSKGSVNTLKWEKKGYASCTTDGKGALDALSLSLKGKRVVLLGAGGAARSIAECVVQQGAELIILNRTESTAKKIACQLGCKSSSITSFSRVSKQGYDLLIQATCVGMCDGACPIPLEELLPGIPVMEVIAAPIETPLVKAAKKLGCPIINGRQLFHHQAKHQFAWWLGKAYSLKEIDAALAD